MDYDVVKYGLFFGLVARDGNDEGVVALGVHTQSKTIIK